MARRRERSTEAEDRSVGLIGAAVRAPLSQGRDGSFPLELEGDDLTEPPGPTRVRGEPTEPTVHSPTSNHVEPRPVATGECTVEVVGGESPCEEEEDG
ncbi:MAG: hypothetical protein Q8P18_03885 [Pseudomonadota bacterium]|nr:hypothetical protein [Pseudomonadota bacterium]